ncbi:MAG: hypothetical protein V3U52_05285 [Thermoplasmata archaeon]
MSKAKFGISLSEDLASWLEGAAEAWGLSRSAVVEIAVESLHRFIGSLAALTETDESRALTALRCLQSGEVPPLADLEALAAVFRKEEPSEVEP